MSEVKSVEEKIAEVRQSKADQLADVELKIKQAELEEIQLRKQEREYSVQDLRSRVEERKVKELQKTEDRAAQGRTFAQQKATDDARQRACTHKKGGVVTPRDMRVLSTGGNGQQYAVIKHQMINGDIWVRCLRCGKTWNPPLKEKFYFDKHNKVVPKQLGVFDPERFKKAAEEYQRATQFETNNTMSGSVQVRFSRFDEVSSQWVDAASENREAIGDTNLR
jgi:hypothetical protein